MKQILLVDDDFLSLNAFYSLVHWENLGVRIAYEAHKDVYKRQIFMRSML